MSDWYPQIVKVIKVTKHPNADSLSIVITSVGDYPIITKLNEYQPGDMAAYIPIDSVVPDTQQFYFLCPKHDGNVVPKFELGSVPERYRRIKAKRLRGVYSQGILVTPPANYNIGDSVVDYFGLTKWLEEEEDNIPGLTKEKQARGETEKKPVGWTIPYYDIEVMRKYVDRLRDDEEIGLTEKIHGANAAFSHDGERLWVKSRNYFKREMIEIPIFEDKNPWFILVLWHFVLSLFVGVCRKIPLLSGWSLLNAKLSAPSKKRVKVGTTKIPSTDQWWDVARRYKLADKLAQYPGLVFFGEVYGQVKGFRYDAKVESDKLLPRIRFFDIWDINQMKYLDYDVFLKICQDLKLDVAPELYRGRWLGKEKMYPYAEGKTTLGGEHVREGFVLRTAKERHDDRLGRMQVKLVGEGYNLQK